jgi:S1-C subfamily serine protease
MKVTMTTRSKTRFLLACALASSTTVSAAAPATTTTTPPVAAVTAACPPTEQLGDSVIASTVTVLADGDSGAASSGSGFFIAADLVATNWHVVKGAKGLRVKRTTDTEPVAVLGVVAADLANDLAIIQLKAPATGVPLALSEVIPRRGARVFAFGSPRLLEATMSDGIVSAERDLEGAQRIQMTAAVSPGSSGGPVTDTCGHVVGIAYMKVRDSEALNFAIPAHFLVTLQGKVGEPHTPDDMERAGASTLRQVTASRLGVPAGVDPERWVQVDPVAQRFFVGIDKRELAGPDFFEHVGRRELLKKADNALPVALYAGAGVCGAASVVTCALSVPLVGALGLGLLTAPIGAVGLCASAGLGAAGFLTWQDNAAPDLPFAERHKMAEAHNEHLHKRASAAATKAAPPPARQTSKPAPGPVDPTDADADAAAANAPVGDAPPPPRATPTPPLDRPAGSEQPRMQF